MREEGTQSRDPQLCKRLYQFIPPSSKRSAASLSTNTVVEEPKAVATNSSIRTSDEPSPATVAVNLKAREPARIMIAIGDKAANQWHLQLAQRLGRSIQLLHQ
jgi:hypothetical protein